jgi:enolase-phosphatase E1
LGVRAVLLDIEGTTTPITFVHDVLFPYARARLREYLDAHRGSPGVAEILRRFADEHAQDVTNGEAPPPVGSSAVAYAEWLMDRDRKSPALKQLQGLIWEAGYRAGDLHGVVFPDVAPAIRRWREAGIAVAIYSSGSELAQRLLFGSTESGDLVPLLNGFFDTAVGPKMNADSYRTIASALGVAPTSVMFVSDVTRELDAARQAGMHTVLSRRPGNVPPASSGYDAIDSFDSLAI